MVERGGYALIVDPDERRGARTAAHLVDVSLPVHRVRDGGEALATLERRGVPELLVTELSLPRVDGFSLIRTLRARPGGNRARVVVLSAFREMREQAKDLQQDLRIDEVLSTKLDDEIVGKLLFN